MTLHHNGLSKMIFVLIFVYCLLTNGIVRSEGVEKQCLTGYMTDLQSWVDKSGKLTSKVDQLRTLDMSAVKNPLFEIFHVMDKKARKKVYNIKYLSMANCGLQRIPAIFNNQDNSGHSLAETLEYITFHGNNFSKIGDNHYDVRINATNAVEMKTNNIYQMKRIQLTTWCKRDAALQNKADLSFPPITFTSLSRNKTILFYKVHGTNQSKNVFEKYTAWGHGFKGIIFKKLKELDLRSCAIQALGTDTFYKMITLTSIYLSENNILYIQANTFSGLTNLKHLDLSRNCAFDHKNISKFLVFETMDEFEGLKIESLDFSFSPIGQQNLPLIRSLGRNLKRLSLCYSGLSSLKSNSFNGTSIRYLDLSGNNEVLQERTALRGLENTLQVLYANSVAMRNMDCLIYLSNLEILKLTTNEITAVPKKVAVALKNLQILDLSHNRLISWFIKVFSYMPQLKLLSLKDNNINIVSQEMYIDVENLTYLSLSDNFVVCSCYVRNMFEVALRSENNLKQPLIEIINNNSYNDYVSFHTGFNDFNEIILNRYSLSSFCDENSNCHFDASSKLIGNYFLLINEDKKSSFECLLAAEGKTTHVHNILGCTHLRQESDFDEHNEEGWNKISLVIFPTLLLPCLLFIYIYKKNLRYFLITLRNSTMLSLISKNDVPDESTIFYYDVFVSYCNEDRAWVLDNLLPHVEKDCNISVCLHERDFQVGLSILENIVSCMDRSRSIMLIISKRFLLSQWCQFEMHLAQHRLLETRREDLILILLEEIPRRIRPNTLQYLMLTKTYIVWPKEETEESLFWKRMNKSIVTLKLKHSENVSLA